MGGRYNSLNEVQGAMFKENFEINIRRQEVTFPETEIMLWILFIIDCRFARFLRIGLSQTTLRTIRQMTKLPINIISNISKGNGIHL